MTDYASEFNSLQETGSDYASEFSGLKPQTEQPSNSGLSSSDWENFMAGAGKGVVDLGRGAKQLIDYPATWLEKTIPGGEALSKATTGITAQQSAAQTQADIAEADIRDKALMQTKAGISGDIAGNLAATLLPLGAASKVSEGASALLNPQTYRAAAVAGGLQGALQPTTNGSDHIWNAGQGALFGMGGLGLVNTVGRIAQPVRNVLSAAQNKAVQTLENYGINLDAAQKTGSTFLNKIRSGFSDNPFTAGIQTDFRINQQDQFNHAALSLIGEDATQATPDVMGNALSRINGTFKDVLDRNVVPIDANARTTLTQIEKESAAEIGSEKNPISMQINRIREAMNDQGVVEGQTAYAIKKSLDRIAQSNDSTLSYHAKDLRSSLMDWINQSLTGEDQQAFTLARKQFRNMSMLEGAIDREGRGDISPSRLASVVNQKRNIRSTIYNQGDTDMRDLAFSGNMLLPDKNPNSGTTARAVIQAMTPAFLGGGAAGLYGLSQGGDMESAAIDAAMGFGGMYAAPRLAQAVIQRGAPYLTQGIRNVPLRTLLLSPETNEMTGAISKRLAANIAGRVPIRNLILPQQNQ